MAYQPLLQPVEVKAALPPVVPTIPQFQPPVVPQHGTPVVPTIPQFQPPVVSQLVSPLYVPPQSITPVVPVPLSPPQVVLYPTTGLPRPIFTAQPVAAPAAATTTALVGEPNYSLSPANAVPYSLTPGQQEEKLVEAADLPLGSRFLGPGYCYSHPRARPLDYAKFNQILMALRAGVAVEQAAAAAGIDQKLVTEEVKRLASKSITQVRAVATLMDRREACCLERIQNPSIGTVTRVHTGISAEGKPLTAMYHEFPDDVLRIMFKGTPGEAVLKERGIS